jgi:hypothetical protein
MKNPLNFPLLVFLLSFIVLWLSTLIGIWFRSRLGQLDAVTREDCSVVRGATLTLLGLIVGFSFSLAFQVSSSSSSWCDGPVCVMDLGPFSLNGV